MRFIPTDKEEFKAFMKRAGFKFSDEQLDDIYLKMCRDAALGVIAANALGGKWLPGVPDVEKLNGMKGFTKEAAAALFAKEIGVQEEEVNPTKAFEFYMKRFYHE